VSDCQSSAGCGGAGGGSGQGAGYGCWLLSLLHLVSAEAGSVGGMMYGGKAKRAGVGGWAMHTANVHREPSAPMPQLKLLQIVIDDQGKGNGEGCTHR
jgi:hypothetical protein